MLAIIFVLTIMKAEAQSSALSVPDSLYALGNYSLAINEYAKTPSDKNNLQIARAYTAIGNFEKAIVQYQALLGDNPKMEIARFELGKLLVKTKDFETAFDVFATLLEKNPGNAEYHYYLGRVKQLSGGDDALISFKNAYKNDTTHLRSLNALGKHYVREQQKDSAFKYIDVGLRFYENDVSLINLKALAYFNDGQYEQAIPYFEKLFELKQDKPFVYKKLGYSYTNEREFEKAKTLYHKLANIFDQEADAYKGLGEVFLMEEQLDSAEIYYIKSIEARKYIFDVEYRNLGRIMRLKNNTKKALEYYTQAWKEDPKNPLGYWQVCVIADEYYKDPKVKLKHYEKLLADNKNIFPFLRQRAEKRISELKEEIHFKKEWTPNYRIFNQILQTAMRGRWYVMIILVFGSCNLFRSETEQTRQELYNRLLTIDWEDVDQYPGFDECDETQSKALQRQCFQEQMMIRFEKALSQVSFEVKEPITDTVFIDFKIGEDGFISIAQIKQREGLEEKFPELRTAISRLLNDTTTVAPAIKRDIPVSMKFRLPLIINTEY